MGFDTQPFDDKDSLDLIQTVTVQQTRTTTIEFKLRTKGMVHLKHHE